MRRLGLAIVLIALSSMLGAATASAAPRSVFEGAWSSTDPTDRATYAARKLEHLRWERYDLAPGALALAQVAKDNADDAYVSSGTATTQAGTATTQASIATSLATVADFSADDTWVICS